MAEIREYVALVHKKTNESDPTFTKDQIISIQDYNKIANRYYCENVVSWCEWKYALQDRPRNKYTDHKYTEIEHIKYQFATARINVIENAIDSQTHPSKILDTRTCKNNVVQDVVGMLSNFRDVTAQELFTIWFEELKLKGPVMGSNLFVLIGDIPKSLQTYSFLHWVVSNFTSPTISFIGLVIPSQAKIMTGAQFNQIYTGKLIRMLTKDMIHNGFQWRPDQENICPRFCPVTPCNLGLYFTLKTNMKDWLQYNKKIMYYCARVTVPDHATVKIEDGKFAASSLIIYKVRPIYPCKNE